MCIDVSFADSVISSLGELKAKFLVLPEDYDLADMPDISCLCNVDVEAVLIRAGVSWFEDVWGFVVNEDIAPQCKREQE